MIERIRRSALLLLVPCATLAMAQAPGSVDLTFNPNDVGFYQGDGTGGEIFAIVPLANGKTLIGMGATGYNNQGTSRLFRIDTDGSLDGTFAGGANLAVRSIAVQTDGKAVIGGSFTTYFGVTRTRVARVNTDGSLDASFDPGAGANDVVHAVALQSDGKVLVGGNFTTLGGQPKARIARLNTDGGAWTTPSTPALVRWAGRCAASWCNRMGASSSPGTSPHTTGRARYASPD